MQIVAAQQDKELCEQFAIDVSTYEPHMLVFVDETGSDCWNTMRRYGYGLRGKPPCSCKLLVRGERISVISAMKIIRGAVNVSSSLRENYCQHSCHLMVKILIVLSFWTIVQFTM